MKKLCQKRIAQAIEDIRQHRNWLATLPKQWECGDVVIISNPLAEKNNFDDENAPVYSEGYFFMLTNQHADNEKLFYAVIVDEGQFDFKSCIEVDFKGKNFNRAYPLCGLWVHLDDLDFDHRNDRLPKEVVNLVRKRLASIVDGSFDADDSCDDPDYLDYVAEFSSAIKAIENKIQKV